MNKKTVPLNKDNCKGYTGFELYEIMAIAGYLDINPQFDGSQCKYFHAIYHLAVKMINIEVVDSTFLVFKRHIFLEAKYIENIEIRKRIGAPRYLSVRVLLSQIMYAEMYEFESIALLAFGLPGDKEGYNGSTTWGQLGVVMTAESQISNFKQMMKDRNLPYDDLFHLLMSKDRHIWISEIARSYLGQFYLKNSGNTISRKYLKIYLEANIEKMREYEIDTSYILENRAH